MHFVNKVGFTNQKNIYKKTVYLHFGLETASSVPKFVLTYYFSQNTSTIL